MKNIKFIAAVLSLSAISFGSFAATEVQNATGEKIGVVSVSGADTLDSLTEELSKKADEAGASYFRVVAATGHNKLYGIAELYK
ncbi:multiple stress resistance protein BhsA [Xenorhabdus innexi]|uniref:Multiple stress resistance protein BhsA n=1 Tax=Xenorhabdus innexi TaxID=290109 RepID=A0A1N6MSQ6_9GAMM|nr:YdgH/BhsA/McbA-like domain containing protein [Xenorhabdus innexi]PHM37317.1 Multiple stress resistance protein BhsA [Xenorhabdus innexi]SIP71861.1 Multiple stress resistance protein BhsA [Xenorhabdus innexi]